MSQESVDAELEALAGQFASFDLQGLASQLNALPPKAKAKILDPETSKRLEQIATPTPKTEGKEEKKGSKKKGTKADKVEAPLRKLSLAALPAQESLEETREHLEIEELERLSQLSERNAQEIEHLKTILEAHAERLEKQQRDISMLLTQNTELRREVSSLKATAQSPIAMSHGSRAGHFPSTPDQEGKADGREIKAADIEKSDLQPNPMLAGSSSGSKIKKKVVV